MSLASAPTSVHTAASSATAPQLSGRWLVLARIGWATLAALIVAFFLANLPAYFAQLSTICQHAPCARWQLTPASAKLLRQFDFSPTGYALVSLIVSVVSVLVWSTAALVIAWRQSRQWLALLTSLLLITEGVLQMSGSPATIPLEYGAPAWHAATMLVEILSIMLYVLVFALFPTGRFVPTWMRWAIAPLLAVIWVLLYTLPSSVTMDPLGDPFLVVVFAGVFAGVICAQKYRYRRVSTPVERQQTKWIVLGVVEGPLLGILYFSLPTFLPALSQPDSLYFLMARQAYIVLWLFCPLCVGISILRYHLWDIDVIIRRTLVYGTLSAILAALYFGLVVGLQTLVGRINSAAASYPVVVVGTTLLIAALFNPLRHRIQALIDQRFYRHKYDAAKMLHAFSATLRSEMDLAQAREQLVAVVQETMQLAHVWLWMPTPARQAEPSHELPRRVPPLLSSSGVFVKPAQPKIPKDGVSL
jgi:hypothetical protein